MATSFRTDIWEQLQLRDKREAAFHPVVVANQQLARHIGELRRINQQQEAAHGALANDERMAQLSNRIRELQEERAEMYETQSKNAQRLLEMNDQLRAKDELKENLRQRTEEAKKLQGISNLQKEQLREKDGTIQILQDELSALHLEITTTEQRNKALKKENAQLVKRWLDKMNAEADKMNEATAFYENFLEEARNTGKKVDKSGGRWVMKSAESRFGKGSSSKGAAVELHIGHVTLPTMPRHIKVDPRGGEIRCIQASKTGSMFATGGENKTIKIYRAGTGDPLKTLTGALQAIISIDFSTADELIAAASADNAARIWDIGSEKIKHTLTGHIGEVYAAKFSSDSSLLVTGSHDRTIKVWDTKSGNQIQTIFAVSSCNDLCLLDSYGSHTIVSGHVDGSIRFWNVRRKKTMPEKRLYKERDSKIHSMRITSLSLSSDGNRLLTNSRDNTLCIVDIRPSEDMRVIQTFHADSYRTSKNWSNACFSPDDRYVAAGSADGELHIWEVQTGALKLQKKAHKADMCSVSWHPHGKCVYTADGKTHDVCIWDTTA